MSRYADIGLYRWSQSEEPPVPYKIVLSTFLIGFEVRCDMTPDTRFSPTTVIADMKYQLGMGCQSVIAIHEIDEPSKWCVVEDYHLVEKSQTTTSKNAMGLIGFKRSEGNNLFKTLTKRGEYFRLLNTGFVKLETFKDITRTGKIE